MNTHLLRGFCGHCGMPFDWEQFDEGDFPCKAGGYCDPEWTLTSETMRIVELSEDYEKWCVKKPLKGVVWQNGNFVSTLSEFLNKHPDRVAKILADPKNSEDLYRPKPILETQS